MISNKILILFEGKIIYQKRFKERTIIKKDSID